MTLSQIMSRLVAVATLTAIAGSASAQDSRVAIALFGPHPSLQQTVDGFKEQLAAEGVKAAYDEGHVNFDRSLVPQLLNRLAAGKPDVMLTITTPVTQSAKQLLAQRDFPIVFAPVTDPVKAGLMPAWDKGAPLMTGVSNLPDFDATLDFMKTLLPQMTRVGILYNTGDDSDTAFADRMEASAKGKSVEFVRIGVESVNDIPQRVRSAQGQVDALFIPASSLLQPASAAIASTANQIGLPVFGSNTAVVNDHEMLAALAVDFHRIGVKAGTVAARILHGESPESIPVVMPTHDDMVMRISGQRLKALGLTLPEALKDCDCVAE